MPDTLDKLSRVLYGRKPTAHDYVGGSDANILGDAADRIVELSTDEAPGPFCEVRIFWEEGMGGRGEANPEFIWGIWSEPMGTWIEGEHRKEWCMRYARRINDAVHKHFQKSNR